MRKVGVGVGDGYIKVGHNKVMQEAITASMKKISLGDVNLEIDQSEVLPNASLLWGAQGQLSSQGNAALQVAMPQYK